MACDAFISVACRLCFDLMIRISRVVNRHDYQSFGEELFAGMDSHTTAQGYSSPTDSLRQKFTGKEERRKAGSSLTASLRLFLCALCG